MSEIPEDLKDLCIRVDHSWPIDAIEVRPLIERIAVAEAERDAYKRGLKAHAEEADELEAENAALKLRVEELQIMLDVRSIEVANEEKATDALQKRLEALTAENAALKLRVEALDWQPITPENLPRRGMKDECLHRAGYTGTLGERYYPHTIEELRKLGWTHFRAISAPSKEAPHA